MSGGMNMGASTCPAPRGRARHTPPPAPYDLADEPTYQRWRAWKLAQRATHPDALLVDVADPRALSDTERAALHRLQHHNMALYRSPVLDADKRIPQQLAAQLGMHQLDANWLADEDGISSIAISDAHDGRAASSPTPTAPSAGTPTATTTRPSGASAAWCCTACGRPPAAASMRCWTRNWPISRCATPIRRTCRR
jgi:hypothetical protein